MPITKKDKIFMAVVVSANLFLILGFTAGAIDGTHTVTLTVLGISALLTAAVVSLWSVPKAIKARQISN